MNLKIYSTPTVLLFFLTIQFCYPALACITINPLLPEHLYYDRIVFKGSPAKIEKSGFRYILTYKVHKTYKGKHRAFARIIRDRAFLNSDPNAMYIIGAKKYSPVEGDTKENKSDLLEINYTGLCTNSSHIFYATDETEKRVSYTFRKELNISKPSELKGMIIQSLMQGLNHKNEEIRRRAVRGLVIYDSKRSDRALVYSLRDPSIAGLTFNLLYSHKKSSAIVPLIEFIKDSSIRNDKRFAVTLLGKYKASNAIPVLIETLKHKADYMRVEAAESLGKIGNSEAAPALIRVLQDTAPKVRIKAAWALGALKAHQAVPDLHKALQDNNIKVARAAAYALRWIKDSRSFQPFVTILQGANNDIKIRAAVIRGLGAMKDARAVPHLLKIVNHKNKDIRSSVAYALGEIRAPKTAPFLLSALKDTDRQVRKDAAIALALFDNPLHIEPLVNYLHKEGTTFIHPIILSFCKSQYKKKIALALLSRIENSESFYQANATKAFGCAQEKKAVPLLIEYLTNKQRSALFYDNRWTAANALGKIKDERAVKHLIEALKDKNSFLRKQAYEALQSFDTQEAKAALKAYSTNKNLSMH